MTFNDAHSEMLRGGQRVRLPHWPTDMYLKTAEQGYLDGAPPITVLNVVHGDKEYRWRMPDRDLLSRHWELFVQP